MKKGVLKQTPKRHIKRCSLEVQKLKDSVRGSVETKYLDKALKEIKELPILNRKPIWIRNRKGVLVEIVGRHGDSIKYQADYCFGTWYFDGNRLGKRKSSYAKAMFEPDTGKREEYDWNAMTKVWHKMERSRAL